MAAKHSVLNFRDIPKLQSKWGWFLFLGILLILAGFAAIAVAGWTTLFSVVFLGFLLSVAGVLQIINGFRARKWTGGSASLLIGILYLAIAALCLIKPPAAAEALTLLIAAFFWVGGVFRMFYSLSHRYEHWGWIFFNGLVSLLLGTFIFAEWPYSGLWVIGLFVGIDMLLLGWSWVFLALAARKSN
jgi:uncharacterized membrane protein HdeD (DUF308 family)